MIFQHRFTKLILLYLCLLFTMAASGPLSWLNAEELEGDLNGDGIINIEDVKIGLKTITLKEPQNIIPDYSSSGADVGENAVIGIEEPIVALQQPTRKDSDGDGWPDVVDCKPDDPDIHPGAQEICDDGIDNDCDGIPDFSDKDKDGFFALACGGDDSDDENEKINPASLEVCNDGIDNNGNGLVDGNDLGCFPGCDQDEDGYASSECGGIDSDDHNPKIYPTAVEICNDFIDNNQNGAVDEDCQSGQLALGASNLVIVSKDYRVFKILLDGYPEDETEWEYAVEGIIGGNQTVGTINVLPVSSGSTIYIAPEVSETSLFTITAMDPNVQNRTVSVEVTVYPVTGTLTVVPANTILGLTRTKKFNAVLDIQDIGKIPVKNPIWHVNGVEGGGILNGVDVGKINTNGIYTAPNNMPDPLPIVIKIGVSLTKGQAVQAFSDIKLAELKAEPSPIVAMATGDAGVITGQRLTSDGAVNIINAADLKFAPVNQNIAIVNNSGTVTIGNALGKTVVFVTDKITGAMDAVTIISRTDIDLSIEVLLRSFDTARISANASNASEVEYTCPGGMYDIRASVKRLRGPQAGKSITVSPSRTIKDIFGQDPDKDIPMGSVGVASQSSRILDYESPGPVPHSTAVLGTLRKDTGLVIVGDEPGTGDIVVNYDDEFVTHQATLKHIYTRPDITVQTIGRRSNSTEPYLTEEINVTLEAKNNGGHSVFVGELPIQVTLLDKDGIPEIMDVFYRNSPFSGYAWGADTPLNLNTQTEAMDFILASTMDPLDGYFFGGKVKFRFFARSAGLHTLVIENKCDPTAPKVQHTIMIKKPPLSLRHITNEELDPQSPWVVGSWLKVYHIPNDITNRVSIYDMYSRDSVESFSRNDLPRWNITDPLLTKTSIPLVDDSLVDQSGQTGTGGTLPFVPMDSGHWKVNLSFTQRAYLQSDDLILNVVEPTDVTAVELEAQEDDWEGAINRGNTIGSIQIAPLPDKWIQGVPIPITIQTFSADPNDHTSKTMGRRLTTQRIADGKLASETVTVSVAGVSISSASGHTLNIDGNLFPTDTPGEIVANVTVTEGPSDKDLILRVNAAIHSPSEDIAIAGILIENRVINSDNNSRGRVPENGNGLAIALFSDTKNKTYINQCALISGRGLAFSPRQLPITSAKVKQAVQEQRIPTGKDKVVVYAEGTGTGFITALGNGVSTSAFSGFPANVVVEKTEVENARLKITLDTSSVTTSGRHEIVVTMNDGKKWTGPVQLVKIELDHPLDHDNEHIPLNGNHHEMHPVGTNMVIAKNNSAGDSSVPNSARIHLFPSLKPGDPKFRGQDIDQPLVGWRRELNDQREFEVSLLEQDWLMQRNNFVIVYGNITDKATYDPVSGTLSRGEGPDMLPDFVSRKVNAETVAVSVAGNFADAMFFTAFNFVAEAEPDDSTKVPEVDFDTLKDGPIETVYSTYRGGGVSNLFDSGPQSVSSTLADGRSNKIVSVSVDTETGNFTRLCPGTDQCEDASFKHIRSTTTNRIVPGAYHGGILDQYYLAELRGSPYTPPGVYRAPIGQDGRVGAFDGEFGENGCRPGTSGAIVECFGIELDGVLYDPALLINDLPPNHKEFLEVPLVGKYAQAFASGWENWLDDNQSILKLFPDVGGTSGGRFVLQTKASYFDPVTGERRSRPFQGSHKVLAKTPGQDFPGIYAGYPIQGTALDLKTPWWEIVKDDIDDAALMRDRPVGPLTGERTDTLEFGHRRRMMTYGSNHDKKAPINTSLTRNIDFAIMTDPPGLDGIEFRAALRVREIPREYGDNIDLIVTTMSDGWEDLIKLGYDTTIDIIAEIIAKIALNAVTGGTYTAACASTDTVGTLLQGALKSRVEKVVIDAIGTELHVPDYFGIEEQNPLYGRRRTPQLTFKALDPDVLQDGAKPISLGAQSTFRKLIKNLDGTGSDTFSGQLFSNTQGIIKNITLCDLLKQPITAAAGMLKDLVSKESLGGGGAAHATASKVMVIIIPDDAAQDLDGKRVAWFQVDKSLMITPDEENVHDINLALNPEINSDKGSSRSEHDLVKDLIVMMNSNIPGSGKYNEAAWFLKILNSPTHVAKRSPDGTLASALKDTYEDYRVRITTLPTMGATVVPNGTVSDFKLTTGSTKIPVTVSSFVTALRSNENAGARACIKNNGYEMIPLAASIPGPNDQ